MGVRRCFFVGTPSVFRRHLPRASDGRRVLWVDRNEDVRRISESPEGPSGGVASHRTRVAHRTPLASPARQVPTRMPAADAPPKAACGKPRHHQPDPRDPTALRCMCRSPPGSEPMCLRTSVFAARGRGPGSSPEAAKPDRGRIRLNMSRRGVRSSNPKFGGRPPPLIRSPKQPTKGNGQGREIHQVFREPPRKRHWPRYGGSPQYYSIVGLVGSDKPWYTCSIRDWADPISWSDNRQNIAESWIRCESAPADSRVLTGRSRRALPLYAPDVFTTKCGRETRANRFGTPIPFYPQSLHP